MQERVPDKKVAGGVSAADSKHEAEEPGSVINPETVSACGLILAGGRNSRMGGKLKAALTFSGETALERIAGAMAGLCRHIYVAVAADTPVSLLRVAEVERRAGVPLIVLVDQLADIGPLGGIVTALRRECAQSKPAEAIWISAGDMPFVSSAAAALMIGRLHDGVEAVVPDAEGRRQPLQAVYRTQALYRAAEECAAREFRSMERLLSLLKVTCLGDDVWHSAGIATRFVRNVNTPGEYERAIEEDCRHEAGSGKNGNKQGEGASRDGMDGRNRGGENPGSDGKRGI